LSTTDGGMRLLTRMLRMKRNVFELVLVLESAEIRHCWYVMDAMTSMHGSRAAVNNKVRVMPRLAATDRLSKSDDQRPRPARPKARAHA
jgi:hypothetical protein